MKYGELLRVRFAFCLLGTVPVFLAGWFGYVQVAQAGRLERPNRAPLPLSAEVADNYAKRSEALPAPRGSILDRNGATLAADCEAYEIRARVRVPSTKRSDMTLFRPWLERLADSLAMALVADPEIPQRSRSYAGHRQRLREVMWRAWKADSLPLRGEWPAGRRDVIDFLVAGGVDRRRVLHALDSHDQSKAYPTLHLQRLHTFRRVYPERDLTYGIVGHTLTGEAVVKRRSMFAERLGDSVAHPSITLVDDPTNPHAFTATAIDGEGLAARRTPLIDNGVLTGFLHNSYSGRRVSAASTGSAVRSGFKSAPGVGAQALALVPGDRSQAELIADIDNGFLVQGVAGLHSGVNPVSGDFSTGAEGLRIRKGALAEPIREVTIASTVQRLLHDIIAIGDDLEWLPMSAAGVSLVVGDVTMSGA